MSVTQHPLIGETTVEVECLTQRAEPSLCDGWSETIELDAPAFSVDGDRVILPGFDGYCPECGDTTFKINGREMIFHV